jgi:hypothetical protein
VTRDLERNMGPGYFILDRGGIISIRYNGLTANVPAFIQFLRADFGGPATLATSELET